MQKPLTRRYPELHGEEQACLSEEARAFLEQHVTPAVLEVFPEWQGFLLRCQTLDVSVWIVRTPSDGQWLHQATGLPALLLKDVLAQKGRCLAEVWDVLRGRLIVSPGNGTPARGDCKE